MLLELATLQFIILHTLDGRATYVNIGHIVSLAEQKGRDTFTGTASCLISTVDHKFITVMETCESIRIRLDNLKK
jgi:hypothetical protein